MTITIFEGRALRSEARGGVNRARIVQRLQRDVAKHERLFAPRFAKLWKELGVHVEGAAGSVGQPIMESKTKGLSRASRSWVNQVMAEAKIKEWQKGEYQPLVGEVYALVGAATAHTLKSEGISDVNLRKELAARILREGGKHAGMADISGETKEALFRVILFGKDRGYNPVKTARLIRSQVSAGRFVHAGPKYRAELIARTETLHAQRFSSLEMYRESAYVRACYAIDGLSDAQCAGRNGSEFSFEEAQIEMDTTHPNCILTFAPVMA